MQNYDQIEAECPSDINSLGPWKDGPEKDRLVNAYFWLDGVVRCSIACIGIMGNIVTIIIFSSKELRSTFHIFLVVLAWFDLGYLFLTLLEEIPQMQDIVSQGTTYPDPKCNLNIVWVYLYPLFIHPLQYVFLTASEYFTMVISIDRFIAIKYPLRYYYSRRHHASTYDNNFLDQHRSKNRNNKRKKVEAISIDCRRVLIYSVSVFVFSLFYCIPVFFEYESIPPTEKMNGTINETTMVKSEAYAIGYYIVLDCLCRFVLPVCVLLYTNYGIYKIVARQPRVTNMSDAASQRRAQNFMLFGVVFLLMIVHAYRFGLNMYQIPINEELKKCGKDARNQIIHIIAYLLLTLNCSGNCFVYLATSKRFRKVALRYYQSIGIMFIALSLFLYFLNVILGIESLFEKRK